jgi:hypothetical protein
VLIHGLTMPSMLWDKVARGLAERGYNILLIGEYTAREPQLRPES